MAHSFRPSDTSPEAHALLIAFWKSMTISDRVARVDSLNRDVEALARTGIVAAHPEYSDVEILVELARRRYGSEFMDSYATLIDHA